ncbi:MAG TPA: DNA methyltransferase [Polyangiaceae bacterium]|nr:DNA methyltransferase [Polyangiaceae bacterium]
MLEQLSRERLAELTERFELDVADRRSIDAHVDAIVRKRSLDFGALLDVLHRDELKAACEALGVDGSGREKAPLVARILGQAETGDMDQRPAADADNEPSFAAKRHSSTPPPMSVRSTGALKSELRRFVLDVAGGYKGRDAAREFASRLLRCFGWSDGQVPDASMPAELSIVSEGERSTRNVALLWNARRVLVDVVKHDVMLDFAWKALLRVCLQLNPVPQYVILTNQRDLQLYDLGRDREAPRLSIALDDLPKYSEAFPFLSTAWTPGTLPKIINVSKVSREVAELVARVYTSLKEQHPKRGREVVEFTLQCILTMFAEDIGLLPQEYFTTLLYDGARNRDVERRLRELFRLMSTRDVPSPRAVPFFNGGLFTNPVTLPLGDAQLAALTKASEANWKYVDPHIFGSVFQGIMNDAERHKSGAHYTAHEDIMRVVGPTIVDPWRQRIRDAKTLAELLDVRAALLNFRVLDPACGSGNFLYVAFRELYRLDTELLGRIRDFPSTQGQGKARVSWASAIQASNFFGLDVNPFAVELAKVTLNIAKKIAFSERLEFAADMVGQLELDIDPSLPLDNLDKNIVCSDALFTDWPTVDAIVGNPPFLGEKWLRKELGADYVKALKARYPNVGGDFCVYWFRRAHEHLAPDRRAGLIATSGIRLGSNRKSALDFVIASGGTITNAVSEREWPGEANVHVSMVNWYKGNLPGPHRLVVGEDVFERDSIATHLQLHADVASAAKLQVNSSGTCQGVTFGTQAFYLDVPTATRLKSDAGAQRFIQAVANGDDVLGGKLERTPDYAIHLGALATEAEARMSGAAYQYLLEHVKPLVRDKAEQATTDHYKTWFRTWWRPFWHRRDFLDEVKTLQRVIACSRVASRPIFFFLSTQVVPVEQLQLFGYEDDYSFGVLQSSAHWQWAAVKGGRREERIRYSIEVWRTFPWPQEPTEDEVAAVAKAGLELRRTRERLAKTNGWSLRDIYQAAEVPGPHPLKDAQAALDEAVQRAYSMPAEQDSIEFLLELNQLVAEDEVEGRSVQGPGLPRGFEPRDPRWMSADRIEPPFS